MIKPRPAGIALAAGLAAGTLLLSQAAAAQPEGHPSWRIVFTHRYGGPTAQAAYYAVASAGPAAAWAVGAAGPSDAQRPVAVHWNGRKWLASTLPAGLTNILTTVSVDSSKDAWAASALGGYVLHWNGTRWRVAKRFREHALATEITGLTAFSPTNVWVFGGSGAFPGVGTWHLHGSTWTRVRGLGGNVSFASAISPTDIWAVGGITVGQDAIVHYIGGHWRHVVAKPLAGLTFRAIVARPGGQVWASASPAANTLKSDVVRLSAGRWRALAVPWRDEVGPMAFDGHGGVWLTGSNGEAAIDAIHLTAAGKWFRIRVGPLATSFFGLNWISGTRSLWGAGNMGTKSGLDAAVWAYGKLP